MRKSLCLYTPVTYIENIFICKYTTLYVFNRLNHK